MKKFISVYIIFFLINSCTKSYDKAILNTEKKYYNNDYNAAIKEVRTLVDKGPQKNRLLYLMEAGTIFHSAGDYKKSNTVFLEAEQLIDQQRKSVTEEAWTFVSLDSNSVFKGESFEIIMVKLYIALNYLMMDDFDSAQRYFKKVNFDLKEMKINDADYKQNLLARYLAAIILEYQEDYNGARVEYKNIEQFNPEFPLLNESRMVLAMKSSDDDDLKKFAKYKNTIPAYSSSMQPNPYNSNLGELIIINEFGISPVKESRGMMTKDPLFMSALRTALFVVLNGPQYRGQFTMASVIAMLSLAENPIPVYKSRTDNNLQLEVLLNGSRNGFTWNVMDYNDTVLKSFNENYNTIVKKNISRIAVKIVAALAITHAINKSEAPELVKVLSSVAASGTIAATTRPDLRCWHLSPSNFQIQRYFLEPGNYELELKATSSKTFISKYPSQIQIEKRKPTFVILRSYLP